MTGRSLFGGAISPVSRCPKGDWSPGTAHSTVSPRPHSLIFSLSFPLRIVLMDDAMDCLMSFSDFLLAFQIQFYYSGESLPGAPGLLSGPRSLSRPAALSICVPGTRASPLLPWRCASPLVTSRMSSSQGWSQGSSAEPTPPRQKTTVLPARAQ